MNTQMLRTLTIGWLAISALSSCAFFDQPFDDQSSGVPAPVGPALAPTSPPLPSPSQNTATQTRLTTAAQSGDTFFIVASIFDVPETVPNLSFVHFTNRSGRRETAVCEALLNTYPITTASEVPPTARNLIVWPIIEGQDSGNCRDMIRAHEPLEVSSETAAIVNSKGPYLMSRSSSLAKQMIYNLSEVSTGDMAGALNNWQQVIADGAQNWPPVVNAK